jgi:hypothetical protein
VAVHRKQARRRRDRGKERSSRAGPTRFKGVLSTTLSCSLFLDASCADARVMERTEAIIILLSEPRYTHPVIILPGICFLEKTIHSLTINSNYTGELNSGQRNQLAALA